MRTRNKHIAACISATFMAVGCASLLSNDATAPEFKPVRGVKHSGEDSAAALYAIGRFYHGQMRYEDAIAAYRQLLEQNPNHAEARNALGVIHASQGRIDKAIEAIDRAISAAPQASHLRNNLGYAYILQGRYAEAEAELLRARTLDPANDRAAENLGLARSHLTSFNNGPAASPSSPADVASVAEPPPAELAPKFEGLAQLIVVGPNVYELRFASAHRARAADLPAENHGAAKSADGRALALEVSNGNGIGGFARRTSAYLQRQGYPAARLTNQRPFGQTATEIQYRGGFQLEAQELRTALAGKPIIVESSQLRAGVEVRLVLGRDATPATLLAGAHKASAESIKIEPQLLN